MIKFEKIRPGMRLWDYRRASGEYFPVDVIAVNPVFRKVRATWNQHHTQWVPECCIVRYREKLPQNIKAFERRVKKPGER